MRVAVDQAPRHEPRADRSPDGIVESIATAIGAGILLGGFMAGIYRLVREWPRQDRLEAHVLIDGYAGGLVGIAIVLLDLALRYGGA